MDCTPGRKKVAVVERYLIRVNVWTVRRAEKSGSCREVFNKSQCMDCTPDQKKVAVCGEVAVTGGSTVLDGNFFSLR